MDSVRCKNNTFAVFAHLRELDNLACKDDTFLKVAFNLYWFYQTQAYLELNEEYKSISDFAKKRYKISKSTIYNYLNVVEKFGELNPKTKEVDVLKDAYKDYSSTALIVMSAMTEEQLQKCSPDMTVSQLRKILKNDAEKAVTDKNVKGSSADSTFKSNNLKLYSVSGLDDFKSKKREINKAIEKVLSQNDGNTYRIDIYMSVEKS